MDKEQIAIMRLKEAAQMSEQIYNQPLVITDSGGKDSSVCVHLAENSGIKFEVNHSHTTADAPETVYFIRYKFKKLELSGIKCGITYPIYKGERTSMWEIIKNMGPPGRLSRHCCSLLKEQAGIGRFITTGVRWSESKRRGNNRGIYEKIGSSPKNKIIINNDNDEKRALFESCQLKGKRICNPIVDWDDRDVWDYIKSEKIPINPLYKCGFSRVGCVGCPLASTKKRYKEFAKWPKYKDLYIAAFRAYINRKKEEGKNPVRETVEEVFHWWMEDGVLPGQIGLFDEED